MTTQHQSEVLDCIRAGMTNQQIAERLELCTRRIGYIVTDLKKQMGESFPYRKPGPKKLTLELK